MKKTISIIAASALLASLFSQYQWPESVYAATNEQIESVQEQTSREALQQEEVNLIINPGFEQTLSGQKDWVDGIGAAGWGIWFATPGGKVSVDNIVRHGDDQSLKIDHSEDASARTDVTVEDGVSIIGAETYLLSAWIKTEQVQGIGLDFRTYYYQDGKKIGNGPAEKIKGTREWEKVEQVVEMPAEADNLRVEFMLEAGGGVAWVDDVSLIPYKAPKILLSQKQLTMQQNSEVPLSIELKNIDTAEPIVWSSSDQSIVSVDQQGVLHALQAGSALIRVEVPSVGISAECLVIVESENTVQQLEKLRHRWFNRLTGNDLFNNQDADMMAALTLSVNRVTNAEGTGVWDRMRQESGRPFLWEDYGSKTVSADITNSYSRLKLMALVYSYKDSPLYQNAELKDAILSGLEWMYEHRYNERIAKHYDNWYHWEISTPQELSDTIILMYNDLGQEQIDRYIAAIDRFVPDPTKRKSLNDYAETGANLLDKAIAVTIRGIAGKSVEKIAQGANAIAPEYAYVTEKDGVYEDGSLVQHTNIAYTGGYGAVWLNNTASMMFVLKDSPWEIKDQRVNNVFSWIFQTYEPVIYKGLMMDMVNGRGISRETSGSAKGTILSIMRLSESAPEQMALRMKQMVKEWASIAMETEDYYSTMTIFDIVRLKAIMNDPSIARRGELNLSKVYAGMDRVIHAKDNYSFGISLFSNRISAFEYGNGENRKGWYTGIGMTYLYNNDLKQYRDDFWPTVDSYRLAGTTTDGSYKSPGEWASYYNPRDFVGGSSLAGLYSAAAMDFSLKGSTGSPLEGKKSWFMFDNEIVAVGSGITNSNGQLTETIIDNRKIADDGANLLMIDDDQKDLRVNQWEEVLTEARYAHLTGNVAGSDIGYYFPEANQSLITVKRETNRGSWQQINTGQSADMREKNYISLAVQHGKNPQNSSYAYVLLPNLSAAATKQYSQSPDITILSQTNKLHAVQEKTLGVTGYNFFEAGEYEDLRSLQPASIVRREHNDELSLAISDPTQKQNKMVIELGREVTGLINKDERIRIIQTAPYLKLEVDMRGSIGRSHEIQLHIVPNQTVPFTDKDELAVIIPVSGDTYINDGACTSGTSACQTKNYGSSQYLNIKNGSGAYKRETLLKFDMEATQLPQDIDSVKLYVFSRVNDSRGGSSAVGVYQTDHAWEEAAVTWETRPSVYESLLDHIDFTSEQKWRAFDLTDFWLANDFAEEPLSVVLRGLTNDLTTDVLSKEYEGGKYSPYLEFTPKQQEVTLEKWQMSGPEKMLTNGAAQLQVFAHFSNASKTILTDEVQFSSSDTSIATVSPTGMVEAHSPGKVTITATYSGLKTVLIIEVRSQSMPPAPVNPPQESGQLNLTEQVLQQAKLKDGKLYVEQKEAAEEIIFHPNDGVGEQNYPLVIRTDAGYIEFPAGWLQAVATQADPSREKLIIRVNRDTQTNWESIRLSEQLRYQAGITSISRPVTLEAFWTDSIDTSVSANRVSLDQLAMPVTVYIEDIDTIDGMGKDDRDLAVVYQLNEQGQLEYAGGVWDGAKYKLPLGKPGQYQVVLFVKTFADVPATHWASPSIAKLAARQLIAGTSTGLFQPERMVTRAEFAAMLVRLLDIKEETSVPFADVDDHAWYKTYIARANAAGIMQGYGNGEFRPDARIKREEMAAMMIRAYSYMTGAKPEMEQAGSSTSFDDTKDVAAWAATAIEQAAALGLMHGKSYGLFHPKQNGTRAESAAVLWRLIDR